MKFTAVILVICLLLSGCAGNSGTGNNPSSLSESENLTADLNMYAIRENGLNPLLTVSESGRVIFSLVYRPLVTVGQNFDYSYNLAATITPSSDCSVYTIKLKDDVKWHDGSSFTSSDVDYTVSKIMEYADASPYYHNLSNVSNCYNDGAYGYVFVLDKSDSGFPSLLNFPIIKNGSAESESVIVGTGEYSVKEYKDYTSLLLQSQTGHKINVALLPDSQSAASSFKLGKLDFLKISSSDSSLYLHGEGKDYISSNTNNYTFLAVNHNNSLLSAPSLRRIIAKILSSDTVINDLVPEYAVKADSFVNPSAFYAVKNSADYGDIKTALEELGYTPEQSGVRSKEVSGSKRLLSFNLLVNAENSSKVIAADYIANLLGTYGFKITVTKTDFNSYKESLVSGSFDLALCETSISLNNDYSFLAESEGRMNFGGYSSESADNLFNAIAKCSDKTKKVELLTELQKMFYNDMPHIPLWFSTYKIISKEKLPKDVVLGGISDEFSNISSWNTK